MYIQIYQEYLYKKKHDLIHMTVNKQGRFDCFSSFI